MNLKRTAKLALKIFGYSLGLTAVASFAITFWGTAEPVAEGTVLLFFLLLVEPATRIKHITSFIPGADEDYHYYSLLTSFDYIALLLFYLALSFVIASAWLWLRAKIRRGHGPA